MLKIAARRQEKCHLTVMLGVMGHYWGIKGCLIGCVVEWLILAGFWVVKVILRLSV
jgi:hypothetical protein